MPSEKQIIGRVLKGHTESFRDLMRRHQAAVFRLAYGICGRREAAEDAVQETFIRVYQSLESYTEQGKFLPWVRKIAVNVCLKTLSTEIPSDEVAEMLDSAQSFSNIVEAETLRKMEMERVRKAVTGLPGSYRTVVVLRFDGGYSYKEIAELLGESTAAVEVRVHRAKKMLAKRLAMEAKDEMP